ncbi:putative zinc-binding peptidase [Aureibaculum sp. A20]|uniref:Zinc-binding peptidase n=1 Tax=Aureibaculum flavum TaxID=2795986 RepID=A0ABS0WRB5_9FLAO|nr:putative zinc-binding peptidase [Aureibaculum flavum]MBJ2174484.1 putative zinc-binding peptidase [Aureibaculum flavum]
MKIFQCGYCDHSLYFENYKCDNCGHLSGFRDIDRKMLTFNPSDDTLISDREHIQYKYCKNKEYDVCNWLIKKDSPHEYCRACQLNRTIPNLSDIENFERWQHLEIAKHRLIYQLQKIGLILISKEDNDAGFCFDFVAQQNNPNLMTGHANGVITVLLREADSVHREQMRKQFSESYRTLIGHLRHEVGHYFWERLVLSNTKILKAFRETFGNEEVDYGDALQHYYKEGAPENWQKSFISKYATSHPWEDWAETWAHYLHIMDMVETSFFFGLKVNPKGYESEMKANVSFDPYTIKDFNVIIDTCVPLTFAVNSINRAMGLPDVYPFVISPAVIEKLKFIHQLLLPKR